ncbi:MAG TPA: DUF2242 domain-containing protein [Rhodocyclaceae bacterium]
MTGKRWTWIVLAGLLATCGGSIPVAREEPSPPEPRHRRDFADEATRVCDAVRLVLLGDGYVVQRRGTEDLVGARESHLKAEANDDGKEEGYAHFRVYASCVARSAGSTLFVTATEERFGVKALRDSTLIGLPLVSPISIGTRTEGDQQVKFRGQTIEDQAFYDRFYRAVREELAPRPRGGSH